MGKKNAGTHLGKYIALIATVISSLTVAWAAPPGAPTTDPDLQPGFPVKAVHDGGGFHDGPAINTLVGNIDDTPDLEIIVSGHAAGPLYAWKSDGTLVPGWPVSESPRFSYPVLGVLQGVPGKLDVLVSYYGSNPSVHVAYSGAGIKLPGWPRNGANYVSTPASSADIDGDGRDEMFVCEEDGYVHMYRYDGSSTVVAGSSTQGCHTPAVADLDGDGTLEIITTSDNDSLGTTLQVAHHTGFNVAGFPVRIAFAAPPDSFPVVGDVDGDGALDIVVVVSEDNYPWRPAAKIISGNGVIKREIIGAGVLRFSTAPALADLDGDGVPEIIFQADGALNVFRGDGTPPAGLAGRLVCRRCHRFAGQLVAGGG
jgi:FG-GAP-like repeat